VVSSSSSLALRSSTVIRPLAASSWYPARMRSASFNLSSHAFASWFGSPRLPLRSRSIISSRPARNLCGSVSSADPVERYRDLLREALASGNAHVRAPGEEPGPGEHLGWTSPEGTFLYPDVSLCLAKRMAESVGDPLPFSGQTMNKRLYERGWLVATNLDMKRKSIAVRRRVEGRTETVLHLKPEFLEQG
jgi:hypothetical protein